MVQVLNERGLTFNRDKCQYKMAHLEFMGHVLSEHGVGPTEAKVRAVAEAREPRNAGGVRISWDWLTLLPALFQICQQFLYLCGS